MSSATPPQQRRDEDTQPHGPLSGPEGCPPSTHRLKSDHARLIGSSIPQRPLRTLLLPLQKTRQSRATGAQRMSREASAKRQRNLGAADLERAIPLAIRWCWKSQPTTLRHAKTRSHTGNPGAARSRILEIADPSFPCEILFGGKSNPGTGIVPAGGNPSDGHSLLNPPSVFEPPSRAAAASRRAD